MKGKNQKYNSVSKQKLLDCPVEDSYYFYDEPEYSRYEQVWYICDRYNEHPISEPPYLLIEKSNYQINLYKIDSLLAWFSEHYQWSIIPWQNIIRFRSFVFITKDKERMDKFVSCSSNIIDIPFVNKRNSSLLINTYQVNKSFSDNAKAIVFEENINSIVKICDICETGINPPKLITSVDLEQYSILNLNKDLYTQSTIKAKKESIWKIYYPRNKKSFELISRQLILKSESLDGVAFWISQNANVKKIQQILAQIKSHEINYSDLSYLRDFLDVCNWLYGFGRDITAPDNHNCSLFISRNSRMIKAIDVSRQENNNFQKHNYHYNLLASF